MIAQRKHEKDYKGIMALWKAKTKRSWKKKLRNEINFLGKTPKYFVICVLL